MQKNALLEADRRLVRKRANQPPFTSINVTEGNGSAFAWSHRASLSDTHPIQKLGYAKKHLTEVCFLHLAEIQ
jgi:hypothetical protein